MAFQKNVFVGNTVADASEVNENFVEIYTELERFPGNNGNMADGGVTEDAIAAGAITRTKLADALVDTESEGFTDSDNNIPTSALVKNFVEDRTVQKVFALYHQTVQTTITSSFANYSQVVLFPTKVTDDEDIFVPASNSFQPTTAGYYEVWAQVTFNQLNSTHKARMRIEHSDGSLLATGFTHNAAGAAQLQGMSCAGVGYFNGTSDSVDVRAGCTTSEITATAHPETYFAIRRIY
jgi:hypothetical protein